MPNPADYRLYLITDRKLVGGWDPLFAAVERALEGGAGAVQLRERDLSAAELYPPACEMRKLTARFGAHLLINDRLDVALAAGADGVHLGGHSLPPSVVRQRFGAQLVIGVSTHSGAEVVAAGQSGADFVTFGPVFLTTSKAAYGPPLGVDALREACLGAMLPVYGLGGVTPGRRREVLATGAAGCAAISSVLAAADPRRAAAAFVAGAAA